MTIFEFFKKAFLKAHKKLLFVLQLLKYFLQKENRELLM